MGLDGLAMQLYTALITANSDVRPGVHLLEIYLPQLAQAVQPGQYCMVRCCHPAASDPLLRRPFFIHSVQRDQGICTLFVCVRGRGTQWLAAQQVGATLDVMGPLGHGWEIRSTVRNLLLVSDGSGIAALTFLAQVANEQDLAVTLIGQFETAEASYPAALLPPEVEYHIVTAGSGQERIGQRGKRGKRQQKGQLGQQGELMTILEEYLPWADAAYLDVSRETSTALYSRYERLRLKHFAQGTLLHPLVCANGVCLTCSVEMQSGVKLICRDGPVFGLRDIAR